MSNEPKSVNYEILNFLPPLTQIFLGALLKALVKAGIIAP